MLNRQSRQSSFVRVEEELELSSAYVRPICQNVSEGVQAVKDFCGIERVGRSSWRSALTPLCHMMGIECA